MFRNMIIAARRVLNLAVTKLIRTPTLQTSLVSSRFFVRFEVVTYGVAYYALLWKYTVYSR